MRDYTYDLIKKGLDVSSLRKDLISTNIANVNTPDYKVKRVEFEKNLQKYRNGKIRLSKTNERHYDIHGLDPQIKEKDGTFLTDDGNNVDIDVEMTELAANELYYNTLIRQVNSKLSNLNYVINR